MMIDKIAHKPPKDKMEDHDEGQYYETEIRICDGCNEVGPYMTECCCCYGRLSVWSHNYSSWLKVLSQDISEEPSVRFPVGSAFNSLL